MLQITGAPRNYISGLNLTYMGATTFSVSAGECADNSNTFQMVLGSTLSKSTSTWAAGGSGNGALAPTETISSNTWYHVYIILNPTTEAVDVLISANTSFSPTLPSGYTQLRRIGSMLTDGSNQLIGFSQNGDEFLWATPVSTGNQSIGTVSTLVVVAVPTNLLVNAMLNVWAVNSGSPMGLLVSSATISAQVAGTPTANYNVGSSVMALPGVASLNIRTDTNAQVRVVADHSSSTYAITTVGWIDTRGKN